MCPKNRARLREESVEVYGLEVRTSSSAARHLYEGLGFGVVGTLSQYYEDGADAYRMEMREPSKDGGNRSRT